MAFNSFHIGYSQNFHIMLLLHNNRSGNAKENPLWLLIVLHWEITELFHNVIVIIVTVITLGTKKTNYGFV